MQRALAMPRLAGARRWLSSAAAPAQAAAAASSSRKAWAAVDAELLHEVHSLPQALELTRAHASAKFDESLDVLLLLGVDPRRPEEGVRGMTSLPHGTGRRVRLAVFAEPALAELALSAGADVAGGEELMERIARGELPLDFTQCIATPTVLPALGAKLGKLLGPRKLMPNTKLGTVTAEIGAAVAAARRGQVGFRSDRGANLQASIGRTSMPTEELAQNVQALITAVVNSQPRMKKGGRRRGKGRFVERIYVSSTMGKALRVSRGSLDLRKAAADE